MRRIIKYQDYPEMTVLLSTWFPLFSQGVYLGFSTAFVKYVYYKETKIISYQDTIEVIKHEYAHFVSRLQRGLFNFWSNIIWDYMQFWIKHNNKPMEIEANKIKEKIIPNK